MKKLAAVLFLSLASLALSACEDGITDTSACLSMEFHRFKMGKFVFDLPAGLMGDSEFGDETDSFRPFGAKILRTLTKDNVDSCQLKDKAPYDVGDKLIVKYYQNNEHNVLKVFERKDKHMQDLWTGVFYIGLNEPKRNAVARTGIVDINFGVFRISELANLRVKSDGPDIDKSGKFEPVSSRTIFEFNGLEQLVTCERVTCQSLLFKDDDGLVYEVYPRKYVAKVEITKENKDDPNSFEIVEAEDLPETVIPILNFARSLRNKSVEQDLQ